MPDFSPLSGMRPEMANDALRVFRLADCQAADELVWVHSQGGGLPKDWFQLQVAP